MKTWLLVGVLALASVGCERPAPVLETQTRPPGTSGSSGAGGAGGEGSRPAAAWDHLADGASWTAFTLSALDQHGEALLSSNPSDVSQYCPAYQAANRSDRAAFWVGLISALVKPESNFDPTTSFQEPGMTEVDGSPVISRGLLQISRESANSYGCGIGNAAELHDPRTNLTCGVRIVSRWVLQDGVIASGSMPWRGAARYWSPMRRTADKTAFRDFTSRQAYCRAM